ncbi:hypothetical protein H1C71_025702, partial [Ictidomys tridecemlineatus]
DLELLCPPRYNPGGEGPGGRVPLCPESASHSAWTSDLGQGPVRTGWRQALTLAGLTKHAGDRGQAVSPQGFWKLPPGLSSAAGKPGRRAGVHSPPRPSLEVARGASGQRKDWTGAHGGQHVLLSFLRMTKKERGRTGWIPGCLVTTLHRCGRLSGCQHTLHSSIHHWKSRGMGRLQGSRPVIPVALEAEAGGSQVQSQPQQLNEA